MNGVALVSGGPDSVAAALSAGAKNWLFVDYDQSFLQKENAAIEYLSERAAPLVVNVTIFRAAFQGGMERKGITVVDRNEQLLCKALDLAHKKSLVERVCLGTRCIHPWFDKHGDCTPKWARTMEKKYKCEIVQPITGWPKFMVRSYLRRWGIDPDKLYCSEGVAP